MVTATRNEGVSTVLEPRPLPNFVETKSIKEISGRALAYIAAGFPVHFRGVSGTGKTTLALHIASKIARPVVMIHGDEEFSTSDLVGGEYGYRIRKTVDNFIHSVLKTEEYAGVYRSQDALRDRMVCMDLDHFDEETEIAITAAKSGMARADAAKIVSVVRALRDSGVCEFAPTVRGPMMIAKTLRVLSGSVDSKNDNFRKLCLDILASETSRVGSKAQSAKVREKLDKLIDQCC